jgi:hypothetical protein
VIVKYTVNDVQTWEASTFWPRFHITLGEREEKLQVVALSPRGLTKLVITKLHILPGILQGLAIAKTSRDISSPHMRVQLPPGVPQIQTQPRALVKSRAWIISVEALNFMHV